MFNVGDKIVCNTNIDSQVTKGNVYTVDGFLEQNNEQFLLIIDDSASAAYVSSSCFVIHTRHVMKEYSEQEDERVEKDTVFVIDSSGNVVYRAHNVDLAKTYAKDAAKRVIGKVYTVYVKECAFKASATVDEV